MSKILLFSIGILFGVTAFAQIPQRLSYQAVIRNSNQSLVVNKQVTMRVSILQGSSTGTPVYIEAHSPTTNINGLISIEIGGGAVVSGSFSSIDWANGPYFVQTYTDPNGGTIYSLTVTSQLLSVPYALHARTAEKIIAGINEKDPVYSGSIAAGIKATDTANWNKKQSRLIAGTNVTITNDTIRSNFSEKDPVYSGSIAAGIKATDTANWNNKQRKLYAGNNISISNDTIKSIILETDPKIQTTSVGTFPFFDGYNLKDSQIKKIDTLIEVNSNFRIKGNFTVSRSNGMNSYTFPNLQGSNGQLLQSNGDGTTTWSSSLPVTSYFGMPAGKRYLEYSYTGNVQLFIVPSNIHKVQLEVWGSGSTGGGYGGYASCFYYCNPGDTLRVYVGGRNNWNGGGFGLLGNGGDGTDIRTNATLNSRIIVAGGGGGGRTNFNNYPDIKPGHGGGGSSLYVAFYYTDIIWNYVGGQGGRRYAPKAQDDGGAAAFTVQGTCASGGGGGFYNGGGGLCYVNCPGIYVNNGSLGKGGDGTSYGGGGGYFGGGGISGNNDADNGGGGSSWVSNTYADPPVMFGGGVNPNLGKARISW